MNQKEIQMLSLDIPAVFKKLLARDRDYSEAVKDSSRNSDNGSARATTVFP